MNALSPYSNTILLVDDLPANISVLFDFLTDNGFKVLVAQDGLRALKKAELVKPELILLDVMMPGIDGFETCTRLKANPKTADVPVIFMTALTDTVDKVRGFAVGAADYITKPIQQEEVLARIHTHLNIRRLQQELQNRGEELEKRNAESDAFARTVAHDLKNPLNLIVNYSEMILEHYQDDKTAMNGECYELVNVILQTGKRMNNIINALLLLAGVSKSKNIPREPITTMQTIVEQVLNERLRYSLEELEGTVSFPESWQAAMGYAPWIEEIWSNYISNGLKYGGAQPHLEIGSEIQKDGYVRFWVRDHGDGIAHEAQQQLFIPFSRLHNEQQGKIEGHGLGLSIVQQIIEKLGGHAGVESSVGQGSCFYFTLPAIPETKQ
jgi:signal transduction histidine kinase